MQVPPVLVEELLGYLAPVLDDTHALETPRTSLQYRRTRNAECRNGSPPAMLISCMLASLKRRQAALGFVQRLDVISPSIDGEAEAARVEGLAGGGVVGVNWGVQGRGSQ